MSDRLQFLPIFIAVLLLSLSAHEMAHAWMANRLGDPTARSRGRMTLNPLKHLDPIGTVLMVVLYLSAGVVFGWAKPVPVSPYYFKNRQRGMALVGAAGPVMNFLLAIVFIEILNLVHPTFDGWIWNTLWIAYLLNLALGLFNLIPIPPLDGSRVLGAFLSRNAYQRWVALDQYGMFIVLGAWLLFRNSLQDGLWWAISHFADLFLTNYPGLFS
jgi:Zn-dependent protease